uniref:Metalloendopeptidase n=1 Tax=Meloidogyne incognita TaxID=6306 RepID=A0A914N6R2_MELIC
MALSTFPIIVVQLVPHQINFNFFFKFILLIICINFNEANNQFFDKSIPDAETLLTQADFHRVTQRQKRQQPTENNINDSAIFSTNPSQMQKHSSPKQTFIESHKRQKRQQPTENNINDSAMYNKERFEGDILTAVNPAASLPLKNTVNEDSSVKTQDGLQRNAVRQSYLKWPRARIPYTVSSQYTSYGRERIAEAIDEYHKKTCVEWTPKAANDIDYVHILPDDGCYSLVGKVGGKQPVSLGEGCMTIGIVIHELMHSVGFFHEQSRTDRDDYVNILWDNIDPTLRDQFDKYSQNMIDYLGAKYDYSSVMHYGPLAFSKNGKPTIEPKEKSVTIGQRLGFSPTDLYKVNKLYNCPNSNTNPQQQQTSQQQKQQQLPVPISVVSTSGSVAS